jgi:hypothetical protein
MEKLVRFNVFYNADFQRIIAKVLRQENQSYLVPMNVAKRLFLSKT